ncbi:Hypothetical protein FKW44_011172, partial [Caligus rogercresseyi]
ANPCWDDDLREQRRRVKYLERKGRSAEFKVAKQRHKTMIIKAKHEPLENG